MHSLGASQRLNWCKRAILAEEGRPNFDVPDTRTIRIILNEGLSSSNKASLLHILANHNHNCLHIDMVSSAAECATDCENLMTILLKCIIPVVCSWNIRVNSRAKRDFALSCMLIPMKLSSPEAEPQMQIDLDTLHASVTAGFLYDLVEQLEKTANTSFEFKNLVQPASLHTQQLWYGDLSFYPLPLPDEWKFNYSFARNHTVRKFAGRRI